MPAAQQATAYPLIKVVEATSRGEPVETLKLHAMHTISDMTAMAHIYGKGFNVMRKWTTPEELLRLGADRSLLLACKRRKGSGVAAYGERASKRPKTKEVWEEIGRDDPFYHTEFDKARRAKQRQPHQQEDLREDQYEIQWDKVDGVWHLWRRTVPPSEPIRFVAESAAAQTAPSLQERLNLQPQELLHRFCPVTVAARHAVQKAKGDKEEQDSLDHLSLSTWNAGPLRGLGNAMEFYRAGAFHILMAQEFDTSTIEEAIDREDEEGGATGQGKRRRGSVSDWPRDFAPQWRFWQSSGTREPVDTAYMDTVSDPPKALQHVLLALQGFSMVGLSGGAMVAFRDHLVKSSQEVYSIAKDEWVNGVISKVETNSAIADEHTLVIGSLHIHNVRAKKTQHRTELITDWLEQCQHHQVDCFGVDANMALGRLCELLPPGSTVVKSPREQDCTAICYLPWTRLLPEGGTASHLYFSTFLHDLGFAQTDESSHYMLTSSLRFKLGRHKARNLDTVKAARTRQRHAQQERKKAAAAASSSSAAP